LSSLTRKQVTFSWTSEQENAFQHLKKLLISPPVLRHYDEKLPIEIHTDACDYGIGAVLLQTDDIGTRPLAYASRRLSKAEENFSTTHKEALAIIYALKHFRHYLWHKKFKIVTDHHALCWLTKLKDPSGRLARWAVTLQDFDYEIVYKSGRLHSDADGLSRNPVDPPEDSEPTDFCVWNLNLVDVRELQEEETEIKGIITALENPENAERKFLKLSRGYTIQDGRLYKKQFLKGNLETLLVIPTSLKKDILQTYHDDPLTGGHFGYIKTLGKIRTKYFWPNMCKEIEHYVKTCRDC